MELAALAYLADNLDPSMSWIPRAILDGRQPTDRDVRAFIDCLDLAGWEQELENT